MGEGIHLAEVYDNHVINFHCWKECLTLVATPQKRREVLLRNGVFWDA